MPNTDLILKPETRAAFDPGAFPAGLDARIGRTAAHHFNLRRRRRRLIFAAAPLAAAAMLALAVILGRGARVPGDLNGDGRVDMLDALLLARAVDQNATSASMDMNHDGAVDRADADAIAALAVSLNGGKS